MKDLKDFFTSEDKAFVLEAIREAERKTSAEIRVHLENKAGEDIARSASETFLKIGMRKTILRNGVLFFLAVEDRQFVVMGDDGIDSRVPSGFWDEVRDVVADHFQSGLIAMGLAEGIRLAGDQLAKHFPRRMGDVNELPDVISYGDE
ncbi:MAG: TPM domain-containing protein [Candidatus Omnitrophica bacterium]|nr:TPM domain-containing protein [Candidatus Omnitrophota bacterium]